MAAVVLILAGPTALEAHGDEPRYVRDLGWVTDQIVRTVALRRSADLDGPAPARVVTLGGRRCVEAGLVGLDVAEEFAFDVDEPIELQLLFAAPREVRFAVGYDSNTKAAVVSHQVAERDAEGDWSRASIALERARFANRGDFATDLTIESFYREAGRPRGRRRGRVRLPAAICEVRLSRRGPARPRPDFGGLDLVLTDARTGKPTPARVGLYDQTGRMPLPSGSAVAFRRFGEVVRQLRVPPRGFWPTANRWVFYVDGSYRARLPAGRYTLLAMKGPEHRLIRQRFEIVPGSTRRIERTFERWTDMPSRGWYSGDTHIHVRRRDDVDDDAALSLIAAEDLWVGSTLEMGNIRRTYFGQRWGEAGRRERAGRHLAPGQEDPRTARRGHSLALNLRGPVRDPRSYYLFHEVAEEVRRQGGLWGYAHVHEGWFKVFRGLALDLPFGLVDFLEVLQDGRMATQGWYRQLNLGFKLVPTAGSDYPYLGPAGSVRNYVHVGRGLTPGSWYRALRAGRTFVTNGPMLELEVDGRGMGEELRVAKGARVRVRARATLNPDLGRLTALHLIVHGTVVDGAGSQAGAQTLELERILTVDESQWLAVRARGLGNAALAHSSPVYLIVEGSPFWNRAEAPRIVEERLGLLDRLYRAGRPQDVPESWETGQVAAREWARQKPRLKRRIEAARNRYRELLRRLGEEAD